MTPRVLIVSDPFTPPAYTPRLRFLCEYLTQAGWEVDLYTEYYGPIPFAHTYPIHEVHIYRTRSLIEWLVKSAWSLLTDWRNRFFSRKVRQATADQHFDLVLCCTFSTFPLRAAWDIARERHIPLHIDLRDLDEQVPGAQYQHHRQWWLRPFRAWYRTVNLRRRNAILRHASSISSVSPWHTEQIKHLTAKRSHSDSGLTSNSVTVYNGFDAKQFYWSAVKSDVFLISYIGKLYEFQDIRPIEQAVRELSHDDIRLQIIQSGIPTDQVGDAIRRSSVMVVLTNKNAKGMMTTKFYEALGCEKPVLCVPDDEGVLSAAIRTTNAGIATDSVEAIKSFIMTQYAEWKTKGCTHQAVNPTEQQRFSRQYQMERMEQALQQTLATHRTHQTLVDICWTLFYSNTTYDLLGIRGNVLNSLVYRLFGIDLVRRRAVRRFQRLPIDEQQARVEQFYTSYLEPRKIEEVWEIIEGKDIVLVSQTMGIIAQEVAKHTGAKAYHTLQHKEELLTRYADFDIITDNTSDIPLVLRARHATIITYNNRSRWEHLLPTNLNVTYIETGRNKY